MAANFTSITLQCFVCNAAYSSIHMLTCWGEKMQHRACVSCIDKFYAINGKRLKCVCTADFYIGTP
jgi:hypothetical protein